MIPEGWKSFKLGEVAEIIGGGTPSTGINEYWNGPIPWLTPRDLTNYHFKYITKGERSITKSGLSSSSTRLLPEGTVLLTSRAPIGYLAIAGSPICTNQGFKSFITDDTKVDNLFLYYLLKNNIEQIKSVGTGTTFAEVSGSTLKGIEFVFPKKISEQSQIAFILSSLDDRIELNLQMNRTLEAIAQAIFKEWFIDFRFPGFDGKMVKGLPNGWHEGVIADIYKTTSGGTPSRNREDFYIDGTIRWVKSKELNGGFIFDTEEKITEEALQLSSAKMIPKYSVLVAMYGATVGEHAIISREAACNQAICAIIPNNKYPYTYILLHLRKNMNSIIDQSSGSAQQNISQALIQRQKIIIPSTDIVGKFHDIVGPLFELVELNLLSNSTLGQIRDILLPKLMTGKIRVA